jgi:hypothetical protein
LINNFVVVYHTETQTDGERERHTQRERYREIVSHRGERVRETQKERETERATQTQRYRESEGERHRGSFLIQPNMLLIYSEGLV